MLLLHAIVVFLSTHGHGKGERPGYQLSLWPGDGLDQLGLVTFTHPRTHCVSLTGGRGN